jgi:hypothetical protein
VLVSSVLVVIPLPVTAHAVLASHRVNVTLLKQESSVHTSLANRDSYIVRIRPKTGKMFEARIVDEYPGDLPAPALLPARDDINYSVSLRRAPYCDSVTDGSEIKCFEADHNSWRSPKTIEDQWWK